MTARQIVEMALAYAEMSNAELARRLGWSPQLLNKRLSTGKFTVDEWQEIAKAIGGEAQIRIVFPDGKAV